MHSHVFPSSLCVSTMLLYLHDELVREIIEQKMGTTKHNDFSFSYIMSLTAVAPTRMMAVVVREEGVEEGGPDHLVLVHISMDAKRLMIADTTESLGKR